MAHAFQNPSQSFLRAKCTPKKQFFLLRTHHLRTTLFTVPDNIAYSIKDGLN